MLSSLHKDHRNIARLLELLKQKLAAIHAELPISYLREFSDKYHHLKEDL